jgi:hypothetical protein
MSPLLNSRPTRKTLNPFDGGSGDNRGAGEEMPRLARGLGDRLAFDGGRRHCLDASKKKSKHDITCCHTENGSYSFSCKK